MLTTAVIKIKKKIEVYILSFKTNTLKKKQKKIWQLSKH